MKLKTLCAVGALCLALASSATAQVATAQVASNVENAAATSALKGLLAGVDAPLNLALKDLNADWRRVTIAVPSDPNAMASMFAPGVDSAAYYYMRGEVVTVGTESFVVAYRLPGKKMDFMAMMRMGPNAQPAMPERLTPETALSLTLLNLRVVNLIGDVTRFDMRTELARNQQQIEEARTAPAMARGGVPTQNFNDASSSNLKQIALGMMQYLQDNDLTFPKMESADAVKKLLQPYTKNEAIFAHPRTREAYQPNPALSGRKLNSIADTASAVLFYEMSAGDDGTRGIAYVDGHVERISEAEWPAIKKAARIPD